MPKKGLPIQYGIYSRDFNLIVPVELDRRPVFCRNFKVKDREDHAFHREQEHPYIILKKSGRFGFISSTGVIISEPVLSKKDAVKVIKEKWQQESDEYLRSVLKEMEMELNKSSIKREKELFVQIQQILEAR